MTSRMFTSGARFRHVEKTLAVVASAAFMIATWMPWLVATLSSGDNGASASQTQITWGGASGLSLIAHTPGLRQQFTATAIPLIWDAIAVLGLLLGMLLWLPGERFWRRTVVFAYTLWALVATITTITTADGLFSSMRVSLFPLPSDSISVLNPHPGWGIWLACIALVLAWIASVLLLRGGFRAQEENKKPLEAVRRTSVYIIGATIFTLGVFIWALGFMFIPWATVNCAGIIFSPTHFVHGRCAGMDASDAIVYGIAHGTHENASGFTATASIKIEEIIVAALIAVLIVAWGRTSRARLSLPLGWLIVSTLLVVLGIYGAWAFLAAPVSLSLASQGTWNPGVGIAIACAGLLIAYAGAGQLLCSSNAPNYMTRKLFRVSA